MLCHILKQAFLLLFSYILVFNFFPGIVSGWEWALFAWVGTRLIDEIHEVRRVRVPAGCISIAYVQCFLKAF